MKKIIYTILRSFTLLGLLFPPGMFAQTNIDYEHCGTDEYIQIQIAKHPEWTEEYLNKERTRLEGELQQRISRTDFSQKLSLIYTIPVVVHVLWHDSSENISAEQIHSQIDILNQDFRRLNADAVNTPSVWLSVAADAGIQFCLASYAPDGSPTDGITRTYTNKTSFDMAADDAKDDASGGQDIWNRDYYLNIWVVPEISGSLVGYSTFPPGTPGGISTTVNNDGVVIEHQRFGNIGTASAQLGRIATHEVGHWLNLYHIWQFAGCVGVGDYCQDTPNQDDEHYGCPSFPQISCNNGPNGDMFMNYMDYTSDACENLFTEDQKARMVDAITSHRASLLTSAKCCEDQVTLGGTHSYISQFYKAGTQISSTAKYLTNTYINYRAGHDVQLLTGFRAKAGTEFRAYLGECYPYGARHPLSVSSPVNNEEEVTLWSDNMNTMEVKIYPNPAMNNVNVSFFDDKSNTCVIQFMDLTGRILKNYSIPAIAGWNEKTLDLEAVAEGIYQLVFKMDNKVSVYKLVVQ